MHSQPLAYDQDKAKLCKGIEDEYHCSLNWIYSSFKYVFLQTDLVKILSANEIRAARFMFEFLDKDKDGSVSETEAKDAYRSFYTCLDNLSNKGSQQK